MFEQWPLAQIVLDREAFFAFLQERWPIFPRSADRRSGRGARIDRAVRTCVPRPGRASRSIIPTCGSTSTTCSWKVPSGRFRIPAGLQWRVRGALAGIEIDPQAHRRRRLDGLLKSIEETIPKDAASHQA